MPETAQPLAAWTEGGSLLRRDSGFETWLGLASDGSPPHLVKTAPEAFLTPGVRYRLEHELALLQEVRSPFIPAPFAYGADGGVFFVVRPYVPGESLRERLQRGPLPPRETVDFGLALLGALEAAHQAGVLHRDVKPENVILGPLPQLVDFSLPRCGLTQADLRDIPPARLAYLAPEQSGLLDRDVGEAADLYSVGVVLYECLQGRPPFDAPSSVEVLRQHLAWTPPPLRSLGLDLPRALDEIVGRLLRKDPAERYASAAAALADLQALAAGLDQGLAYPPVVVGQGDARRRLADPGFVGREAELRLLSEALEAGRQGALSLVLLEAPSGGGKTRLLEETAMAAAQRGVRVLRGGASELEPPTPLHLLGGVARDLAALARQDPDLTRSLRRRLGDRLVPLAAALPDLQGLLEDPAARAGGQEARAERLLLRSLVDLLDTSQGLVILDDCQWADGTTLRFLKEWASGVGERSGGTTLVLAFRSEEVQPDHPLRALPATRHLRLAPFDPEEVWKLLCSMAGPIPAEARDAAADLSGGNPFMVVEILRGMVEAGALVAESSGWRVNPQALEHLQSSHRAAAVLAGRLDSLDPAGRRLLQAGAILGRSFDLESVIALAGETPVRALQVLDDARSRRLLWTDQAVARYAFVHDRIRETVLEGLEEGEKVRLHLAAGEFLERQGNATPYDLAYHFDLAGQPARALPYARAAALEARRRYALDLAETQYRIAARSWEGADEAVRLEIALGLGEVLTLRGLYAEAVEPFHQALALARDPVTRARIEGELGELDHKRGRVGEATARIRGALTLLGRGVPRPGLPMVLGLVAEVGEQVLNSFFPSRLGRLREDPEGREQLVADLCNSLCYTGWFNETVLGLLYHHLRHLNTAERLPPTPALAEAWSNHCLMMTNLPWFERGLRYAHRAVEVRQGLGDRWGEGHALLFLGIGQLAASRLAGALDSLQRAGPLLESVGDLYLYTLAQLNTVICHYRRGELREAVERGRRLATLARELGDPATAGTALGTMLRADRHAVRVEELEAEFAEVKGDEQTTAKLWESLGILWASQGLWEQGVEALDRALDLIRRAGRRTEYVATIPCWLTTVRRLQVEHAPACHPALRRKLLRQARAACRHALNFARAYRNNLPQALREDALLAALEGRPRVARRGLQRSLAEAEGLGMALERVLTLRELARLGRIHGWEGAEEAEERFRRGAAALGVHLEDDFPLPTRVLSAPDAADLGLAERLGSLLEQGRRVITALTREEVFSSLEEAARYVLRGQACSVLALHPDGEPLAAEAALAGRPVIGSFPGERRSALAAPLVVEGSPVAVFQVTHGEVPDLFGEPEIHLAGFLAALAGAALEGAEAHGRILDEQEGRHREELKVRELEIRKNALATFLGMASHDLGNLLAVSDLYAQQLSPGLPPERLIHCRDTIHRVCRRASGLIQVYLDASRVEAGQPLVLCWTGYDLAALAREEAAFHAECLEMETGQRPEVAVEAPDSVPSWGDPERIRQVIANLLGNAFKFNRPGGAVGVSVRPEGSGALFEVRDQGPGLTEEQRSLLFRPFERLGAKKRGWGMGLWTCKVVVDAHEGEIGVDSLVGEGCRFWFRVPGRPS